MAASFYLSKPYQKCYSLEYSLLFLDWLVSGMIPPGRVWGDTVAWCMGGSDPTETDTLTVTALQDDNRSPQSISCTFS